MGGGFHIHMHVELSKKKIEKIDKKDAIFDKKKYKIKLQHLMFRRIGG